ncbi:right-handed parallel beta-helix repeat-containing protein [candidate division KSB1 bacterium]
MKRIAIHLSMLLLVISFIRCSTETGFPQDYEIATDGTNYFLRTSWENKTVKQSSDASEILQYAMDKLAGNGGEIKLHRGEYIINTPVKPASKVTLRGAGRSTVLLLGDENTEGIVILMKGLKGSMVSDLSVKTKKPHTGNSGLIMDDCGDCKVQNVIAQGFAENGFLVKNRTFLSELTDCVSANNGVSGFYFDELTSKGRGGDYVANLVKGCISYADQVGFRTNTALCVNIIGCLVHQSVHNGFHITNRSNAIVISGCRTFQIGNNSIQVEKTREINLNGNMFSWHRGHGIVIKGLSWGTITGNNIIDTGVRTKDGSLRNGIVLEETNGLQITGNIIYNWGDQVPMKYGIIEDEKCENNLIVSNNINYFTEKGIVSKGKGTKVQNNVTFGPDAYVGMDRPNKFPDFDMERIKEFIKE